MSSGFRWVAGDRAQRVEAIQLAARIPRNCVRRGGVLGTDVHAVNPKLDPGYGVVVGRVCADIL